MTSSLPFLGKTAIITGGSKGIGAATTLYLASQGANVVVNFSNDQAAADDILSKIEHKDRGLAIKADAGSTAGIDEIVSRTVAKFGKIDLLIACAALGPMLDLASTTEADFDRAYTVNVKGPYFLVQKAVPHMPAGSRIILFSTSLTNNSTIAPRYLLYVSTKGAIEQMTIIMAKDLASKGINVNAISPGPTSTELFMKGKSDELIKTITNSIAMGRLAEPLEIAEAVAFMCGPGSKYITGQNLKVNGGLTFG